MGEWMNGLALLLIGLAGAGLFAVIRRDHRRIEDARQDRLAALAARRGWQIDPADAGRAHGTLDGLRFEVTDVPSTQHSRLVLRGLPADLLIGPRVLDGAPRQADGTRPEVRLGDPEFDRWLGVYGPEPTARALLDRETRAQLLALVPAHVTLQAGALEVRHDGPIRGLEARLDAAVALAKRLLRPADEAALRAVASDDLPAVQLGARALLPEGPDRDAIDALMLRDADAQVVLTAARQLGSTAVPALIDLACTVAHRPTQRIDAIAGLIELDAVPPDLAARCLDTPAVALAALQAGPVILSLDQLQALIDMRHTPLTRWAINHTTAHGATAEPLLLRVLATGPQSARAAAERLAESGSIHAIMPLRARLDQAGLMDGALKLAIEDAIAAIQARSEAEAGALSILGGAKAGMLSTLQGHAEGDAANPLGETT